MDLVLHFENYIGHTYTLALARKVDIEKRMAINSKTGPEKRKIAQQAWLEKNNLPKDYLEQLQVLIDRDSTWGVPRGEEIIITGGRLICALVDGFINFGKALRLKMQKREIRSYASISNLRTGKRKADWTWTRAMIGRSADGKVQATAKRITPDEVIGAIPNYLKGDPLQEIVLLGESEPKPFTVRGTVDIDEFAPEGFQDSFFELLDYVGQHVGVGCSRDMGFGRFYREGGKRKKAERREESAEGKGKRKKTEKETSDDDDAEAVEADAEGAEQAAE